MKPFKKEAMPPPCKFLTGTHSTEELAFPALQFLLAANAAARARRTAMRGKRQTLPLCGTPQREGRSA